MEYLLFVVKKPLMSGNVIHELDPIVTLDAELFQSEAHCDLFESEEDE